MISKLKNQLTPLIAIIAQPFLSWNPHILTLLSLLASIGFCILVAMHLYFWALVVSIGFLFDALDGYVARKNGKVTKFGAVLDSTTDRAADFFILSGFAYGSLVGWNIVAPLILTTFLISYLRSRSETVFPHTQFGRGLMQRSERIVFLILSVLATILFSVGILRPLFLLLFLANCITIVQRLLLLPRN